MGRQKTSITLITETTLTSYKGIIEDEDTELVVRVKNGDDKAFETLADKYKQKVFSICYGFLKNAQKAEDAAQDIFVKVYEKLNTFKLKSKFRTWLTRIAINTCLNIIGRSEPYFDELQDQITTDGKGKEKKGETSRLVDRALKRLSTRCRILIFLKHFQDLQFNEISELSVLKKLDIPKNINAIKAALYRCHKSFRKEYLKINPSIQSNEM